MLGGPILLATWVTVVILAWGARRARHARPRVAVGLVVAIAGVFGGLALVSRIPLEPVALLTDADDSMRGGCFLSFIEGELVSDRVTGTAIIGRNGGDAEQRFPVMWPAGWTGRRTLLAGVEVLNPTGVVMWRTGTRIHLSGGFPGTSGAWLACNELLPRP
jgi:hypothetical protein